MSSFNAFTADNLESARWETGVVVENKRLCKTDRFGVFLLPSRKNAEGGIDVHA
jgi:hypothetical protein